MTGGCLLEGRKGQGVAQHGGLLSGETYLAVGGGNHVLAGDETPSSLRERCSTFSAATAFVEEGQYRLHRSFPMVTQYMPVFILVFSNAYFIHFLQQSKNNRSTPCAAIRRWQTIPRGSDKRSTRGSWWWSGRRWRAALPKPTPACGPAAPR